ncbi:MAG: GlsB/YeaQ/YmgE family stress response membrane protein [Bacteroidia bacterium]|nr:GlsB/YeaQ/YmgE family stress response membrane protein [Bacteroidia bacterium]
MLYSILLGIAIFWVTSKIMNLRGWGLIMNTLFVIAGSMVGKWVLNIVGFGVGGSFIPSLISGVIGCCVVVLAIRVLNK